MTVQKIKPVNNKKIKR